MTKTKTQIVFRWPADKSDGLGTTSRVNQEIACDVPGGAITDFLNGTVNDVKGYFQEAIHNCTEMIPSTRKKRTLIFLGNEKKKGIVFIF